MLNKLYARVCVYMCICCGGAGEVQLPPFSHIGHLCRGPVPLQALCDVLFSPTGLPSLRPVTVCRPGCGVLRPSRCAAPRDAIGRRI